jgi:hypothetical protein
MSTAQHRVHPTPDKVRRDRDGGSLRVFRQFAWLEAGSGKVAFSRLADQRVTQPVRLFGAVSVVGNGL